MQPLKTKEFTETNGSKAWCLRSGYPEGLIGGKFRIGKKIKPEQATRTRRKKRRKVLKKSFGSFEKLLNFAPR